MIGELNVVANFHDSVWQVILHLWKNLNELNLVQTPVRKFYRQLAFALVLTTNIINNKIAFEMYLEFF